MDVVAAAAAVVVVVVVLYKPVMRTIECTRLWQPREYRTFLTQGPHKTKPTVSSKSSHMIASISERRSSNRLCNNWLSQSRDKAGNDRL